ncbi:sodium/hydrogen exchanger [Mycolicibacterium doricum]|uniref:Sodium/hydrogen exchanger n=1 Tax=Mycolicibacterium doricum TaxID=126673 RepID=A0A1X1TJ28_9MYCO|nr:cation:proton antiporter [Mycolicibacterium doricum]MCV7268090.1 cation:proton antiporter [Mycolicibacterium doricum]ORV44469.1 sodium:proton exchanger [Mycolicibacterium doricum]BBZ09034.1 sodium/hydrogen exchanger [Mycolicibacterium doricum]
MLLSLIAVSAVLAGWGVLASRMERWRVTAPMGIVLAGVVIGLATSDRVADGLNTEVAEHVAEIILAILLFVDATDVRGGLFGYEPKAAMRILFVALPLGVALALVFGLWLLPGSSWAVLLVIACIVVPIDFAPVSSILRDRRVPERVRDLLNVEAGYNDGIISPLFIFALVLADQQSRADTPLQALEAAIPQAAKAITVGLVVGTLLALAANTAQRRAWATHQSNRLVLVAAPLLAFGLSLSIDGNGFVSAFVCGIAFKFLRHSHDIRRDLELVDDVGFLLTVGMWFAFGVAAVAIFEVGITLGAVVFSLLALTVVRIVPVLIGMLGTRFNRPERLLVGALGPRGTTTIVFGLLAFNVLDQPDEHTVGLVVVLCVLGSVILHGVAAPAIAHAYAARRPSSRDAEHSGPGK